MADRVTAAGREWMAGDMPAHEYFALVRRQARPQAWRRARPEAWWVRLWRRWRR